MKKLISNILETSKNFWRWKDGTCIFCETSKGPNDELIQRHTFYEQIIDNPIIIQVCFIIGDIKKKCSDKVRNFKEMWEDDRKKHLFDNKNKLAVEKIIDKNPITTYLELKMSYYRQMINEFEEIPVYRNAFFIQVNFGKVISKFKNEAQEWLDKHGKVLKVLGERELLQIKNEVLDYRERLADDPPRIDELKVLLNSITEIKDMTMMMEFRIFDV